MTMMIGHNAIRKPSRDAVIQLINDSFHTVIARTIDTSREPNAALYVGHFSTIKAKISQRIGLNPSMKCRKFIQTGLSVIKDIPLSIDFHQTAMVITPLVRHMMRAIFQLYDFSAIP